MLVTLSAQRSVKPRSEPTFAEDAKLNVLVSYAYLKSDRAQARVAEHKDKIRLLLDSGGFTAWKSGNPIELDDYCRFLETNPLGAWRYFALDVIGDPVGTLTNYRLMRKRGFKPIAIFTRGAPIDHLDEYYETAEIVALGGLVGTSGNRGFVNGLMQKIGQRKTHWLGFTDLPFVKTYKPFSIDSSGWEQSAKYGGVRLYMGNGQFEYFKRWDIGKGAPSERIQARLRMIGIEPSSLAKEGAWRKRGRESRETNRRSMIMACRDIELNLGTKYFLAVDSGYVGELIGSLEMLRQRGLF